VKGGLGVGAKEVEALLESAYEQMTLALEGALEGVLEAYEEVERAREEAEGVPAPLKDRFSEVLRGRKERILSKTVLPAGLRIGEAYEWPLTRRRWAYTRSSGASSGTAPRGSCGGWSRTRSPSWPWCGAWRRPPRG
jgi:hypothetical protein